MMACRLQQAGSVERAVRVVRHCCGSAAASVARRKD